MKIFPKAWVLPGGHIDLGETLETGVIREIVEEVGILIEEKIEEDGNVKYINNGSYCILEPFYAFESVSYKVIDLNPPSSGHLIVFFRIKLNQKGEEINLHLDPREVDGAVWMSKENI